MEEYKVGEPVWILHEGKYSKHFLKVEVLNCCKKVNVWCKLPNGVTYNITSFDYVDRTRNGLIDKLIKKIQNEFVKSTDEIRNQIKALNRKMLQIEHEYNSELDFLNAQKESSDGN